MCLCPVCNHELLEIKEETTYIEYDGIETQENHYSCITQCWSEEHGRNTHYFNLIEDDDYSFSLHLSLSKNILVDVEKYSKLSIYVKFTYFDDDGKSFKDRFYTFSELSHCDCLEIVHRLLSLNWAL